MKYVLDAPFGMASGRPCSLARARHHRIVQLTLKKLPWRQVCQVRGDADAAFVELE